jgi:hypothetical protein
MVTLRLGLVRLSDDGRPSRINVALRCFALLFACATPPFAKQTPHLFACFDPARPSTLLCFICPSVSFLRLGFSFVDFPAHRYSHMRRACVNKSNLVMHI